MKYSISEVSKILNTSTSNLRKYEDKYGIVVARESNKRVYSAENVQEIKAILEKNKAKYNFINYYREILDITGFELSERMGMSKSYISRNAQVSEATIEKIKLIKKTLIQISDEKSNGEQILFIENGDIFAE